VKPPGEAELGYGASTVPLGRDVVVIVKAGGGFTVIVNVRLIGVPAPSVAWTVMDEVPGVVGVPVMLTEAVSLFDKVRSGGKLPERMIQVNGPVAPSVVITPL
jgi:succinyl-CoA synthetase alpha subunit